ncbi:MAG: hypothetical protein RH942_10725, partial [Kiloniellaceae bacterium]
VVHPTPGTGLDHDEALTGPLTIDYIVTDDDLQTSSATISIQIEDDGPTPIDTVVGGTVEEEHLPGGNEDTTPGADLDTLVDFDLTTDSVGGSLSSLVDFGADGPGGFSLQVIENGVDVPVDSGFDSAGEDIVYVSDGTTLTGFVDSGDTAGELDINDRKIFELTVSNTSYTFLLLDQMDHLADDLEDIRTIDFSSYLIASDGDGDTTGFANDTFTIDVIDDVPENFSPDAAVIGSGPSSYFSGDLDFYDNVGADKNGDVVFDPALDDTQLMAGGDAVTSSGDNIFLEITNAGHTLTGWADNDTIPGVSAGDTKVFEINLNPDAVNEGDDEYTMEVFANIDTGSGETFDDFGLAPSGNTLWTGIDGNLLDILLTAGNVTTDRANTSNAGFGSGNNLLGTGQIARIDFVQNLDLDESDNGVNANTFFGSTSFISFANHETVNGGRVGVNGQTGPGAAISVKITAFDADDNPVPNPKTVAADYTDDVLLKDNITHTDIVILNNLGVPVVGVTYIIQGAPVPAGVVVQDNTDGSITVYGLQNDWTVTNIRTADGFTRLEVESVDSDNEFRVSEVGFGASQAGEPIDLSFGVVGTDEDGDSADGILNVTVLPQQTGSDLANTLTATQYGSDLEGRGGNDTLNGGAADDLLQGQGGADSITDGDGNDTIIGGDAADTITLSADGDTDILVYDAISEAGDTVTGFDAGAPVEGGIGGDIVDLVDLLDSGDFTGTTLAEAVADGYVTLTDNTGNAEIYVDLDGAGGGVSVLVVTLNGIDLGATPTALNDNIVVD